MTEHLPFRNETFESISCRIALPLMNIPQALDEMTRVAKPGADLFLSVHPLKFTLQELRKTASAKAKLYRTFVIANGLFFHVTGRLLWYPSRMIWFPHGSRESFQTRSRMRKELAKRGFIAIEISLENQRFLIRARKDDPQSIHN
jgi:ubiquinone/menaquinone biosynthesis C-methylase UbiE